MPLSATIASMRSMAAAWLCAASRDPPFAVNGFEVVEAVVERAGQVRGGAACLATADGAVVEDDDGAPFPREEVRGGEAGDARPHDADVGDEVRGQRRAAGNFGRTGPDRESLSAFRVQSSS
jgi:hypothetical protein